MKIKWGDLSMKETFGCQCARLLVQLALMQAEQTAGDKLFWSHFVHANTKHSVLFFIWFSNVIFKSTYPVCVNQRAFSSSGSEFIFKVSPCSPSTRQVKHYLIKMLCSLPNSSLHIWFSLFVFRGWAATSTHSSISPSWKGGPYGSHFYMLFGMTRLQQDRWELGNTETLLRLLDSHTHIGFPSRERERERHSGSLELQQTVCEPNCQSPLH